MAKVFPFRGVTYSKARFGSDLTNLVTQPYDKITPEMQEEYYKRSPYNFIRIVLGKRFPNDDEYYNQYTRGAGYLQWWLEDGIMEIHEKPAIYVYHQEFKVGDEIKVRQGFVALAELEPPGKGVKAHEKTLAGPKADRLNTMRHTRAQLGHIFMLYSDPKNQVDSVLSAAIEGRQPDYSARDWFGNNHYIWAVTDESVIREVQMLMSDKVLFIADGHHRYETAVNYWLECEKKGLKPAPDATETFRNRMMTFVCMENPGLVVLPTHRVVHSIKGFDLQAFISKVSENFDVEKIDVPGADHAPKVFDESMKKLRELGEQGKHAFLFVPSKAQSYYLLVLKDESIMDKAISKPVSSVWKRLDVSILHKLILEDILGIDAKALEEKRNLYYIREPEKGFEYMEKDPDVIGVFFMNPTKVSEVKQIADLGERMPQKSTDFYPKLVSGLVINKLRFAD